MGNPAMVMTLYCRRCAAPNHFNRRWIDDADACTVCGATGQWQTVNDPRVPYVLTKRDARFLRLICVKAA